MVAVVSDHGGEAHVQFMAGMLEAAGVVVELGLELGTALSQDLVARSPPETIPLSMSLRRGTSGLLGSERSLGE